MKRGFRTVACMFMLAMLFGCSTAQSVQTGSTQTVGTVENSTAGTSEKTLTQSVRSKQVTTTKSQRSTKQTENQNLGQDKAEAQQTTAKKHKSNAKGTTAASSKQRTTSQSTTQQICYITVECTEILSHMASLKAGHEAYVPADGYFMQMTKISLNGKDTVYDILKSACSQKGLRLHTQSSSYGGVYVAGIANIDEKDCGKQSGWLYKVNGKSPSVSCSKYTVSGSDQIVFTYTCS